MRGGSIDVGEYELSDVEKEHFRLIDEAIEIERSVFSKQLESLV
jgi:hypothetical protein